MIIVSFSNEHEIGSKMSNSAKKSLKSLFFGAKSSKVGKNKNRYCQFCQIRPDITTGADDGFRRRMPHTLVSDGFRMGAGVGIGKISTGQGH